MLRLARPFCVILLVVCEATAIRAQQPTLGMIDGIVADTSMLPLSNATVTIVGTSLQVTTGESGRFQVRALAAGSYFLLVRHVGFEPQSVNAFVVGVDTLRITIMLDRVKSVLDTVKVVSKHIPPRLAEFEERRLLGVGQFLTEEDIAKRNSVSIDALFRTLLTTRQRFGGATQACGHPRLFIDGVPINPQTRIEWLPSPKVLAGIEYYSSPATTPLKFKSMDGGGFCGVIVIWTKSG